MSNASNDSKQRWNASHYAQVKISVKPEIANAFKAACAAANLSMASVLSAFMADFSNTGIPKKSSTHAMLFDSRRNRRRAADKITLQMEQLLLGEENYYNNVPESLQGSKWHDASEQSISVIQEIIERLGEIYQAF